MIDDLDWYGPETATFGDRLSAAVEKSGMTQKLVAKRLGIKLATLKSWEQDVSEPRANRLSMLAGLLGVSVMWLLHGRGDGVDYSGNAAQVPPEINDILFEIRALQTGLLTSADKLAKLEKQLRAKLRDM
ncbi:MAG: helix-turn-helix domain-containing protein [Paracoccaceae bacterium]